MTNLKHVRKPAQQAVSLLLAFLMTFVMLPQPADAAQAEPRAASPFTFATNGNNTVKILKFTDTAATTVQIPPTTPEGFAVTEIADTAFLSRVKLKNVYIPDTITKIGQRAFSGCSGLQSILIPGSVTTIGNQAFFACSALKELTILYGVKEIGMGAFANCAALTSVKLAPSPEKMDDGIFNLTNKNLVVETGPNSYAYNYTDKFGNSPNKQPLPENSECYYDYILDPKTGEVLIEGYFGPSREPVVPNKMNGKIVTGVADNAFENKKMDKITLPDTITSIGSNAFAGTGIKEITIPDGVTHIGANAFDDDAELSIKGAGDALDDFLQSLSQVKYIPYGPGSELYNGLTVIENPAAGGTVEKPVTRDYRSGFDIDLKAIPQQGYLFAGWTLSPANEGAIKNDKMSETTLTMPGADTILTANFERIPPEVMRIRNGVVYQYYGSDPYVVIPREYGRNGQEDVTDLVPVTQIGSSSDYATGGRVFSGRPVVNIFIPDSVTGIYMEAFVGARELKKFEVATENKNFKVVGDVLFSKDGKTLISYPANRDGASYTVPAGVTRINPYAFAGARNLKTIIFNGVESIGAYAFQDCEALATPDLNGVKTIESYAFLSCGALESITLPASLTSLGSGAFQDCGKLSTVDGVQTTGLSSISSYAFYNCALTSVTLPPSITSIEDYAFGSNTRITLMYLPDSLSSVASTAFYGCLSLKAFSVDAANPNLATVNGVLFNKNLTTLKTYPAGKPGPEMGGSQYTVPASVRTVDNGAFAYTQLPKVILNQTEKLNASAFQYSKIQSVDLTSITSMSDSAFSNCGELISVTIPAAVDSLAARLFNSCTKLETVIIPEGVKSIGSYGLSSCLSLKTVVLPESLETIADNAFYNCRSLETVNLPSKLKKIGYEAFQSCISLTSAVIPASVTSIERRAFQYCSALSELRFLNPATAIGDNAFERCISLTSIDIPNTITSIGDGAFSGCTSLAAAIVGSENIGASAFSGNTAMTSVTLNEGVKNMGAFAFYNTRMPTVSLPKSLTSIGSRAFAAVPVTAFHVADASASFAAKDGVLYNQDLTELVRYPARGEAAEYTTPATVKSIRAYAFEDASVVSKINFSANVANLSRSLFLNSTSLSIVRVYNPEAVFENISTTPYEYVFYGIAAENLKKLIIEGYSHSTTETEVFKHSSDELLFRVIDEVTRGVVITTNGVVVGYEGNDETVVIPSVVTKDTAARVVNAKGETQTLADGVVIPVKVIGRLAFHNPAEPESEAYKNIKKVEIPLSVHTLEIGAFDGCSGLTGEGLVLPVSIQTIKPYAFNGCEALTTVTLPGTIEIVGGSASKDDAPDDNTITRIYNSAFYGCKNLTKILIDGENDQYESLDGVLVTKGGKKILDVPAKYPGNVEGKPGYFKIPEGVISIGDNAFYGTSFKDVVFPASLQNISGDAFRGAFTDSVNLHLSEGITDIENGAFAECLGLKEITIPKSVKRIGDGVFEKCPNLEKITVAEGNPGYFSDDGILFAYANLNGNVDKSVSHIARYPQAKPDTSYKVKDSHTVGVYKSAFTDCNNLTSVDLSGGNVQAIEADAFRDCQELMTVKFPEFLVKIDSNAFNGVQTLDSIDLSECKILAKIDAYAFSGCLRAEELKLPMDGKLETIGSNAFYNTSIQTVTIPATVGNIGDKAFVSDRQVSLHLTNAYIANPNVNFGTDVFSNVSELTLHGEPGSKVEAYAKKHGIKFAAWSSTGNLADEPEVPAEPEVPQEPTVPDVPVVPDEPVNPDVPVIPDEPANPDVPVVPDEPANPDVPVIPDEPANPENPVPDEPDENLPPVVEEPSSPEDSTTPETEPEAPAEEAPEQTAPETIPDSAPEAPPAA